MKEPITDYEQLREFVIAITFAIGEITTIEAENAINKAFHEFRMHLAEQFHQLQLVHEEI